jgi:hypothetical protein
MADVSPYKFDKRIILLLLVFSCIATYQAYNFNAVYAVSETPVEVGGGLSGDDISMLGGAFAPLVGLGGSPFIALTMLSGVGAFLNSGTINPDNIPFSNSLMSLPISSMSIFWILLAITAIKFLLSMIGASKVMCDATLGQIESLTGTVCAVGGAFLLTSVTTVYAADFATASVGSVGAGTYFLTNVIGFVSAVLAYIVYAVMRTMLAALDVLAFLFSPIPGSTALFTIAKHIIFSAYVWVSVTNPTASIVVGVVLVAIACFVFRAAKRLVFYYKKIYLIPFANALFRSGHRIPLIPKRLPRGVAMEFPNIDICIEGFFMNRAFGLYKRELCYFIKSGDTNYIFKKRLFGKTIKIEVPNEAFIEKPFIFRFLRIFTDEALRTSQRRINLIVRREHGKDIAEIIAKTGLIDYNALLEERRRKKAEEMALKAQQMKGQATKKLASASNKIKGTFGGLFSGKNKTEQN